MRLYKNRKKYFNDDIETTCSKCNHKIIHRPYAPKDVIFICLECMDKKIKAELEKNELEYCIG